MSITAEPAAPARTDDATIPDVPIHRLTVDQYHAMAKAGILTEDDRVELLEGWLVPKMTKNPPHAAVARRLRRILERTVPAGWLVLAQDPITTGDSEPEPDLCVVRGDEESFQTRHPAPSEVALVVEVADTSLRQDRESKKRLYARAGLPIYWIVNLPEWQIEVYTEPSSSGEAPDYGQGRVYAPTETLPVVLDGVEVGAIAVGELLR